MTIKAIETRYAGCRFRSRLEARWAVFFDAMGYNWEYEPEGFIVGYDGSRPYLPDFKIWLNMTRYSPNPFWVEVKGSEKELDKGLLVDCMDWNCGLPGVSETAVYNELGAEGGMIVLGSIPRLLPRESGLMPAHTLLTHRKGVWHNACAFGTVSIDFFQGPGCYSDSSAPIICDDEECNWLTCGGVRNPYHELVDPVRNAYVKARSARFEHGEKG